jgi:hypothetical protein
MYIKLNLSVTVINCLSPRKNCRRGFESHSRHGCLCLCLFCLCYYVKIPRPRSPTEAARAAKAQQRAVEPLLIITDKLVFISHYDYLAFSSSFICRLLAKNWLRLRSLLPICSTSTFLGEGFQNDRRRLTNEWPVSGHQNNVELVKKAVMNTASGRVTLCCH